MLLRDKTAKLKVMKTPISILLLMALSIIVLSSCVKKDPLADRCGNNWAPATELEKEINDLNNATMTYAQNPTNENCEAYKEAYLDYIDAIRDWEDCYIYVGLKDEFEQSIDQLEEAVQGIDCN